jgi:hypothetical protein
LHRLGPGQASERRFGRFLSNRKVSKEEMLASASARLAPLVAGRHVLAIQDTTELNFEAHARRTRGLGLVGNGADHGFFLHPVLVADASEAGGIIGLAGAQIWVRHKSKQANYRQQPIAEKESHRWLMGARQAKATLAAAAMITVVADAESDIYEEFAAIPDARTHLLTRACQDRKLAEGGYLYAYADTLAEQQRYTLALPATKKRTARTATMAVRFAAATIRRPAACPDKSLPSEVTLSLVDVREIDAPADVEPVHWRLLTTHVVETVEQAYQIVAWYCRRWHIEQLFRTLKRQGLDLESSLVENGDALMKLSVLALIAAVRTLQLTLARNGTTAQPATAAFETSEISVLRHLNPTLEGKTAKQKNPHPLDSLAWAAWIIARLGGWNGYTSERPPGPITMLRGLTSFASIVHGFTIAQDVYIR